MSSDPRLIEDMSFADYLGDPAPEPSVTAGILRELLSGTPRHVWERTPRLNANAVAETKEAFDLGSAAHAQFVGHGDDIAVIAADSWRTNAAKDARLAAYKAGQTPLLEKHAVLVAEMGSAAHAQFGQHAVIGPLLPAMQREATIIWNEVGVTNRCRPDFLDPGRAVIVHYKTTAVRMSSATLPRYAAGLGWDLTAAHYAAGVKALNGPGAEAVFRHPGKRAALSRPGDRTRSALRRVRLDVPRSRPRHLGEVRPREHVARVSLRDAPAGMPAVARGHDDGLEGRGARRRRDEAVRNGKQGGEIVKQKDDGRAAFPYQHVASPSSELEYGMTLRQWYAGKALAGITANAKLLAEVDREYKGNPVDGTAILARLHADALIAELDKE